MNIRSNLWRLVGGGVLLLMLIALLAGLVWTVGDGLGLLTPGQKLTVLLLLLGCTAMLLLLPGVVNYLNEQLHRQRATDTQVFPIADAAGPAPARPGATSKQLRGYLHDRYGPFWRHKTRLLLVAGEPAEIEAIAPGLTEQRWLVGEHTVLLWAGSLRSDPAPADLGLWRDLSRWRGLDGLVWALTREQSLDADGMGVCQGGLGALAKALHWHLPLYLWEVRTSKWSQDGRESQPVGCLLPARATTVSLEDQLTAMVKPLRVSGLAQMRTNMNHDFLLRLSNDLHNNGISRWLTVLRPWLVSGIRGVDLRGLWFGPVFAPRSDDQLGHLWIAEKPWQALIDDKTRPRRFGWQAPRIAYTAFMVFALVWGTGMALSFTTNRQQILEVQALLATLDQAEQGDARLLALHELVRQLDRLDYRAKEGPPWYLRFGLSQNQGLIDTLWPRYIELNARLLRDPAVALLQARLDALVRLPPDSPERTRRASESYEQLKAWLMLARPEKVDPAFLVRVMGELEPERAGMSLGAWHELSPRLWRFYADHLEAHPTVNLDPLLLGQARQVLLGQLGQRNAEATLYKQVLERATSHYPDLNLDQMLGETEATLFTTNRLVPGVFTREAWEGEIRKAIDEIAEARREEIDWVLSDNHAEVASNLTPDVLKQHLTARYFRDYSSAWLAFLNSLRWQRAGSLSEVIDQLTVMSDLRLSPLLALMETLAWQGRAGSREQALADSLLQSAQELLGQDKDKAQLVERVAAHLESPLDDTFGPLLAVLGKEEAQGGEDHLTLQAFLTRVTRVRLKLQQISNAADPRESTQALAQTVFQGKSVDLSDTRAYGSLLSASLGAEWGSMGETLFVQPLDEAWQRVLQPSAASLNSQWQRSIVAEWRRSFDGRYPFAGTDSDVSLPMLGQMIRSDSGRIDQFLSTQLSGVLRKEGSRWVADPQHSQGLRFNPRFLEAVNQLSHLSDVLYTPEGGLGMSFELRGKPVSNVIDTQFILNGEKHHYFNQKERWQRFYWPGQGSHPGTRVLWTSVGSDLRMYGDYQGTWGLIRFLENAKVTLLDDGNSRYHLEVRAPDGKALTWHLRTELGEGPLALLRLRGFRLPARIFLDENAKTEVAARNL